MFRIILSHNILGDLTIDNPPLGWDDIEYELARSDKFWSVARTFTGNLVWVKDAKTYIDNAFELYGLDTVIGCNIKKFVPDTLMYTTLLNGVLKNDTYIKKLTSSECRVVDGSFEQTIYNRSKINIMFGTTETVDGKAVIKRVNELDSITLNLTNLNTHQTKAVAPFLLFERIIQILTGTDKAFKSDIFSKGLADGYPSAGKYGYEMIVPGKWIRGYTPPISDLSISLDTLFESLDAIFNVGLGFETINNKRIVVVKPKSFFFQPEVILTLEDISDLEISPIAELHYNEIEVGYAKSQQESNDIGQIEYNGKSTYTTPITSFDKSLKLISNLRADGTGLELLTVSDADINDRGNYDASSNQFPSIGGSGDDQSIKIDDYWNIDIPGTLGVTPVLQGYRITASIDNPGQDEANWDIDTDPTPVTNNNNKSIQGETDIFIVDCFNDNEVIKSVQTEGFFSVSGQMGTDILNFNVNLTPERNLRRHGEIINIGLPKYVNKKIKIQTTETNSRLKSKRIDEEFYTTEGTDINIVELAKPYLSGYKANMNSHLGINELLFINENIHGLVKYKNYLTDEYDYGWIKKASTSPTDSRFNIELWLKSTEIETSEDLCIDLREDDGFELREDGGYCLCESF